MNPNVKKDIINVLSNVIEFIKKHDYEHVLTWSNRVIHDASIYQDDDSVSIAVLVYGLGNLLQRCCERNEKAPEVVKDLQSALRSLKADNINAFHASIKKLINIVSRQDSRMKLYIQEVMSKAKIRKASHIHQHGISIARTSELLGISQWELQEYVGATIHDLKHEGLPVLDRLKRARSLFR